MHYLHTMVVRIRDIDQSLRFYRDGLGLIEIRRAENQKGRFTLFFLEAAEDEDLTLSDKAPILKFTYGAARNFGHLALPPKEPRVLMPNTGTW